jgi:hypothetical protein
MNSPAGRPGLPKGRESAAPSAGFGGLGGLTWPRAIRLQLIASWLESHPLRQPLFASGELQLGKPASRGQGLHAQAMRSRLRF